MNAVPQPTDLPRDALGRPLHDLRLSVIEACNFRCPYCMPAEIFGEKYAFLPRHAILTFEETRRIAIFSLSYSSAVLGRSTPPPSPARVAGRLSPGRSA